MSPEKWERIARLLKEGPVSNREAARRLRASTGTVAKVRADLGMAPYVVHRSEGWTARDYEELSVPLRGGHVRWRGRHSPTGAPMAGKELTAYRLAFRLHHGRDPVGRVTGTCRMKRCVAGAHLADAVVRAAKSVTESPAQATYQGLDMVAIRRALTGPAPYPPLTLAEQRAGFRLAASSASVSELAGRLGLSERTVQRWRTQGAPR